MKNRFSAIYLLKKSPAALLLGMAFFAHYAVATTVSLSGRPNVLIIMVDDLGYGDHSVGQSSAVQTPSMERLADQGLIFENGYITHPYCGPSRAGFITGRHQARFGLETNPAYSPYDYYHGLPLDETTLAERLASANYRTGLVGKWHLGAAPEFHPLNRGFESFFGFLSGGHDYFEVDFAAPHQREGQLLYSPIEGELLPLNDGRSATGFKGYLTDVLTDRAIDFLNTEDDRPFFLFLAYNAPHGPLQAPPELIRKYEGQGDWARRTYLAMIESLDTNLGRLLDTLEISGQRENTLIFFFGDNGGVWPAPNRKHENWACNGALRAGKGTFYEGGIRVPFIGSWPKAWPSAVNYAPPVSSLDIAATAIAAAGISVGEGDLDGVDLTPFVANPDGQSPHEFLYWRSPYNQSFAIRSERFKLLRNSCEGDTIELYDLSMDPSETTNLLQAHPKIASELANAWNSWNRQNRANRTMEAFFYQQTRDEFFRQQARSLEEKASREAPIQIQIP